jgi:hypothetical protein
MPCRQKHQKGQTLTSRIRFLLLLLIAIGRVQYFAQADSGIPRYKRDEALRMIDRGNMEILSSRKALIVALSIERNKTMTNKNAFRKDKHRR